MIDAWAPRFAREFGMDRSQMAELSVLQMVDHVDWLDEMTGRADGG